MAHAKNKGDRNRIQALKFKNRLRKNRIKVTDPKDGKCYRTTSTPCSCSLCDPHKWGEEKHTVTKKKSSTEDQD